MEQIKVGSDFSGVGAFNQALIRLGIPHKEIFACDMDRFARQTFELNYGKPEYYPTDVYDREIPETTLDIYMTSPPCQAFSLAGKRKGEEDKRGVLFYNSHEFIQKNRPRYFIFENVKGLLSDDSGKTFQRWIDYLGGKSVNGNPVIFPHEESAPYHVYYQVLNAKHYGIPQNRERIFIIGIRDDSDNDFSFPKPFHLTKRLKDVLENKVDEKYFLSDKSLQGLINHRERHKEAGNGFGANISGEEEISNTIRSRYYKDGSDQLLKISRNVIQLNQAEEFGTQPRSQNRVYDTIGVSPAIMSQMSCGSHAIQVHSNTSKGYDIAEEEEDSINFSVPNSETRRGRIGKKVSQTLDTQCNQGIYTKQRIRRLTPLECFRLMDFNEDFKWDVSDSQAYKQAGNSICVGVLAAIIDKLNINKQRRA